ncbi:hypothetical protein BOO86_15710 [Mycobacterium sp. CBMA 234]|uniref:hypothetical protein n=1 Tax=Mycolicibacterium sp. CBMA 234 TaxID=1918495 RepID=UPI0012DC88C2|nr:hypothetical protein [Mycolicibacterium sp. CBMA 234]MUL65922.1 hypothetical protein [Mycolicibacterium sp. CBMA 234]
MTIGDVKSLQGQIASLVPSVSPRPAISVTIGSTVKARLTADAADASVDPIDPIDNSIGEQTSILFGWQVHPRHSGDLLLIAHIEFPLANTAMHEQLVPLRIYVHNTPKHVFLNIVQNFWMQLAGVAGVAGGGLKWLWGRRTRRNEPGATPYGDQLSPQSPDKQESAPRPGSGTGKDSKS